MHNSHVELQGKCRRVTYAKVDIPSKGLEAGDVIDVWSGGGAIEGLTGDELMQARYNDPDAGNLYGCIEEYFATNPVRKPVKVDLTKVEACCSAVDAHRAAKKAEADFVFEKGIKLFGSEQSTTAALHHTLKIQEVHTRDNPDRTSDHDAIVQAQTDLDVLCNDCEDCCEQLLATRDAAITFAIKPVRE